MISRILEVFCFFVLFIIYCSIMRSYSNEKETADIVLKDGKIVTMDESNPVAQAIAAEGDTIIAVGSNEEIQPYIDDRTKVIDLNGQLAVPGFIDGHAHLIGIGRAKMQLNITNAQNWNESIAMVEEAVKSAALGQWIIGSGWHQEKWNGAPEPNVEGYPVHDALSKISPQNPVLLTHASGHMCFANAKAMELAGISKDPKDPEGGTILRDSRNNPIGVAQGVVNSAYSKSRQDRTKEEKEAELEQQIELAMEECVSKGITSFHDASSSFEMIDKFKEFASAGRLKIRLWVMINESNNELQKRISEYRLIGFGNKFLTVRAIKRFMDGALGTHGAWLLQSYSDLPDSVGMNVSSIESIEKTAQIAINNGFQLCTHAIGDRANREVVDIYEKTFKNHPSKKDMRWRIEHAQHLYPDDIPRFGELGVIAAMQGCHCTSDAPYVIERLGKNRAEEGAYVWCSLMNTGAVIVNGTDAPVEDVDPIACFYASVTRKLKGG